ncbi:MAG: hypothetical protein AAF734_07960 [Bacteroidota bacterium]
MKGSYRVVLQGYQRLRTFKPIFFMFVTFDQLPSTSRTWIFQANRKFDEREKRLINTKNTQFITQWTAHNQTLEASAMIEHDCFIILAVNEAHNQASGCSIDKMTHFIQSLESEFNISLLDRSLVGFIKEDKMRTIDFKLIKEKINEGEITPSTLVFDNTIDTLAKLKTDWLKPAQETWLQRYF